MTKRARQGAILQIIDNHEISTQSDLATALASAGHEVAQTTVSRDLGELGVIKVRSASGSLIYARPGTVDADQMEFLARTMQRWVRSIGRSRNLVVIDTPNGFADPVSEAIDESGLPSVLGTIAGENTVLVIAAKGVTGQSLEHELAELAGLDRG